MTTTGHERRERRSGDCVLCALALSDDYAGGLVPAGECLSERVRWQAAVYRLDGQMIWNSAPDDYPTADDALNAAQAAKAEGGPDDPR